MRSVLCFSLFFVCLRCSLSIFYFFFFFNDTATTEIYTLSLHDALPICAHRRRRAPRSRRDRSTVTFDRGSPPRDGRGGPAGAPGRARAPRTPPRPTWARRPGGRAAPAS